MMSADPLAALQEELNHERVKHAETLAELRQTQAMLIHSERMNALGHVVAGVAHEINNPVAFVNSNLHSLTRTLEVVFGAYDRLEALALAGVGVDVDSVRAIRSEAKLDFLREDTVDLLNASTEGLRRIRRIVDDLRKFSRLDEAELKVVSIKEILESTLPFARLELQARVKVILDMDALPEIKCYPAELNQVFLNLMVNAAQATEGRGTLTIRGRDAGDTLIVQFIDTGAGMPPEILNRIFEPFFTTKHSGTGLGLAIANKIITEWHKGTIQVESMLGQGSTFTITLPKDLES